MCVCVRENTIIQRTNVPKEKHVNLNMAHNAVFVQQKAICLMILKILSEMKVCASAAALKSLCVMFSACVCLVVGGAEMVIIHTEAAVRDTPGAPRCFK